MISSCFFFFQAEDGIRYRNVTGVQTCALPISSRGLSNGWRGALVPSPAARYTASQTPAVRVGTPYSSGTPGGRTAADALEKPVIVEQPAAGTQIGRASCRERG